MRVDRNYRIVSTALRSRDQPFHNSPLKRHAGTIINRPGFFSESFSVLCRKIEIYRCVLIVVDLAAGILDKCVRCHDTDLISFRILDWFAFDSKDDAVHFLDLHQHPDNSCPCKDLARPRQ